jgi:hypothetical protein
MKTETGKLPKRRVFTLNIGVVEVTGNIKQAYNQSPETYYHRRFENHYKLIEISGLIRISEIGRTQSKTVECKLQKHISRYV